MRADVGAAFRLVGWEGFAPGLDLDLDADLVVVPTRGDAVRTAARLAEGLARGEPGLRVAPDVGGLGAGGAASRLGEAVVLPVVDRAALHGEAARLRTERSGPGSERVAQAEGRLAEAEAEVRRCRERLAVLAARADELDAEIRRLRAGREDTAARQRVAELLLELDAVSGEVVDPAAEALARRWEEHRRLVELVEQGGPVPSIAEAKAELAAARRARDEVAAGRAALDDGARVEIEELHRAVEEAEAAAAGLRRSARRRAEARIDAARQAEAECLARHGFRSRAEYLLVLAAGAPRSVDPVEERVRRAERALERARAVWEDPRGERRAEEEVALRSEAAALLGRFPRGDVAADLRSRRIPDPRRADVLAALRDALAALEVDAGDDPEAAARRIVGRRADPDGDLDARLAAIEARYAEVDREGTEAAREYEEALEAAQRARRGVERARVEAAGDAQDLVPAALRHLLAEAAAASQGPIVVADVLAGLDDATCEELTRILHRTATVRQVVLVSDHPWLVRWADGGVAGVARADARSPARDEEPGPRRAPSVDLTAGDAACARHPARVSGGECGRCGRACCDTCRVEVGAREGPLCLDCALVAAGVRARRRRARA